MIVRSGASSDVGRRRRVNEDHYLVSPELGIYLVADGMGGHKAGQLASELASEGALRAIQALRAASVSMSEKLRQAVACANQQIYAMAQAQPEYKGMGTTLVAIMAGEERAALAHVGDSRAYLIRGGQIRRLTDDHSLVGELLRRREISEAAAREHPHRHVLTRALGVRPNVAPDLAEITPEAGDVFAMCSDGLTNHVRDDEIAELARGPDLQASCDALIALANDRGGIDNTTVLLLRYEDQ